MPHKSKYPHFSFFLSFFLLDTGHCSVNDVQVVNFRVSSPDVWLRLKHPFANSCNQFSVLRRSLIVYGFRPFCRCYLLVPVSVCFYDSLFIDEQPHCCWSTYLTFELVPQGVFTSCASFVSAVWILLGYSSS